MDEAQAGKAPTHLWIVGVVSLIWNSFGGYDYLMTRMRNTDYLASAMPGVDPNATLAWIDSFPIYAQIGWGLGVWGGVIGSILLLIRSRWAVHALGLSLLGAVASLGYQIVGAPPLAGADKGISAIMPFIIIAVALALFLYARAMNQRGVLR